METFATDWLTLREAADARSRDDRLLSRLSFGEERPLRVIDLGAGAGSNLRYLSPRLPKPQHWILVDQSKKLLDKAVEIIPEGAEKVVRKRLDLAKNLDKIDFKKADLVTASAFLDLISASWLRSLVARLRKTAAPVLFSLTYDGRIGWAPADEDDRFVLEAFNRHQATNKGFGPALGPKAPTVIKEALEKAGYRVLVTDSAWKLRSDDSDLQRALLMGYKQAATEIAPDKAERISAWTARRWRLILEGESNQIVGHRDILGLPGA